MSICSANSPGLPAQRDEKQRESPCLNATKGKRRKKKINEPAEKNVEEFAFLIRRDK